jgi:penicillin-binding protein 1A
VQVDVGPAVLALDKDSAASVLRWRDGAGRRIAVGDVLPIKTARDKRGEPVLALAQRPDVQAALVAIDPATGRVEALVGGYDYTESQYNRVTQAQRQVGSAIKPFIYAAALQHGFTHLSMVVDAPVHIRTAGGIWAPKNFKPEYLGRITVRTALALSINTVSVRLVQAIGVDRVIAVMRALGITSKFPAHISIALGTPDLTLLELTSAYAAFPAGGRRVTPRLVDLVTTDSGVVLEDHRHETSGPQAIPPELAYLMVDLMGVVIARGTGKKAGALGHPTAGKTGTSADHEDAWFLGTTAQHLAGVWVGRDDSTALGDRVTGGRAALPIWLQYMTAAHAGLAPRPFPVPPDILLVRANELTGAPLAPGVPGAVLVPFARGTLPARFTVGAPPQSFRAGPAFAPPRPVRDRKHAKPTE